MEKLIHEYRGWLIEAKERGLLLHDPKVGMVQTREGRIVSNHKQQSSTSSGNSNLNPYDAWDNKLSVDYSNKKHKSCVIL
jgi:hypothetical protein